MTCPKTITLNCLVVIAGIHQVTAVVYTRQFILLIWEGVLNMEAEEYSWSMVQCASLLSAHPTSLMKQVMSAKQMAQEATMEWTSALNRWQQ